jgi:hypothetical protein
MVRPLLLAAAAIALFIFSWLLRYNDPEGSYLGLSDDHFYYVIRGWQMLFGELPDRDYVDAGAPLAYGISAALQLLIGRGTWPEFVFCVTALALGAAIVTLVAARASGSVVLGVLASLFTIALLPRLYNYPKIVVYACAIPVLWWWIARPRATAMVAIAIVTMIGFLLRHDHGLYVAIATGLLLIAATDVPWRERARHAGIYALATLLLLAPYFVYLQQNGGIVRHFVTGYEWAQRDRDRAPLELPTLTIQPLFTADTGDAPPSEWWNHAPFTGLRTYRTWWLFWLAMLLPFIAAGHLLMRPAAPARERRSEMLRIGVVIVFALLVNSGFLRGNLAIQIPDVSVPMAILGAWCIASMFRRARDAARPAMTFRALGPAALAAAALLAAVITAILLVPSLREQLENSSLLEGIAAIRGDAAGVTERLQQGWPIDSWAPEDSRGPIQLAYYVKSCTAPTDRVFVTPYLPQVTGLAERGFAGGHGDLRAGFFATDADQALTIQRLRRQSVPIVIGPSHAEREEFDRRLPVVARYLDEQYRDLGDRDLGEGLVVSLLVSRTARSTRTFEKFAAPCFR